MMGLFLTSYVSLIVLLLLLPIPIMKSVATVIEVEGEGVALSLKRSSFPADFVFGTASSAYQYEGATNEGGKGPNIWDTFIQKYPNKIVDQSNGSIGADSYHRYKEDVQIMKELGFNAYRISISWSRLLPGGNLASGVNKEGIRYYNNLINELLSNGVEPFVTLAHYDYPPQSLEDAYGGFLSPQIVKDFADYADVCFREFGDRVKYWITINGPSVYSQLAYAQGEYAPGRCSNWLPFNCTGGDSATEPYIVTHHQILAHAAAVKLYRQKYQESQMGQIGIIHGINWIIPLSQSAEDVDAASRVLAFTLGWFMEPLVSGSYPDVMVKYVGERLPRFSQEESNMVKNSFDFFGFNYYSTAYAAHVECQSENKTYLTDQCAEVKYERNGIPIGPKAASDWIYVYPQGIEELLLYMKNKYNNPVIYITENGFDDFDNGKKSMLDKERIDYHIQHLSHLQRALLNGVNVKGYFAWSLLDNFEWNLGYTVRFGIIYVDYDDGFKKYAKGSAKWFKRFLHQEIEFQ
ncbi:hypothetical protein L6164_022979 [Bauhinia variegata]|uniref:Uncharacterized protein n=1 Tax=Bauhinia variegata TaxID=167791 RepID=A0ACB9MI54_BAUVA|nr:hypothetical protein L6164_022979 [Bauhinia variegata]